MHSSTPKALRAIALSVATLAAFAATQAAQSTAAPLMIAKADTAATSQFLRNNAPATTLAIDETAAYPSLAEAELIGMGYASFDTVLAEALGTATAAGYGPSPARGAVEAVVARIMGGLMP